MAFHPDITRKDDVTLAMDTANAAVRIASRQLTGNAGTVEIPNADGTSTIMGVGAGETGVATWVGNKTAPGKPLGITATSGNGMIVVTWNGTLDGGIPAYFARIAILIDGVEADSMTGAGSRAFGMYESGSVHTVSAIAYDDAHLEDGSSAPNASVASDPISVTVESSDIDPSKLGIVVTKATTGPTTDGVHKGDLWLQYDRDPTVAGAALRAEWWWDGTAWQTIPVAMYLDQLAARDIQADSAVIGMLAAGIITSGLFQTASSGARVKMDSSGITGYNSTGAITFRIDATTGDVSMIGKFYSGDKSVSRVVIDSDYNKISDPGYADVDGYIAFESHLSDESPFIGGTHGKPHGVEHKATGMIIASGATDSKTPSVSSVQLNSFEGGNGSEGMIVSTMDEKVTDKNTASVDVKSDKNGQMAFLMASGPDEGKYASVQVSVDPKGNPYVAIVSNDIVQVDPVTKDAVEIYSNKHELTSKRRCVFNWENDWTGVSTTGSGFLEGTFNFSMSRGWYLVESYVRTNGTGKEYHLDMNAFRPDGTIMDTWLMNFPMPSRGIGNMVCSQMVYVDDADDGVDITGKLYSRDYGSRPELFTGLDARWSLFSPKRPLGRYFRIFAM